MRRGRHARPEIHTFIYEAGLKDEIFALSLYYTTSENLEDPTLKNRVCIKINKQYYHIFKLKPLLTDSSVLFFTSNSEKKNVLLSIKLSTVSAIYRLWSATSYKKGKDLIYLITVTPREIIQ